MLEKQANKVFLGIGSNLGNKKLNIENAKLHLELNKNFRIFKTSKFYKTKSWPNPKMPNFLNIVIEGETYLKPLDLLFFLKKIEKILGRKPAKKNSPRICDIDIIDFDHKCLKLNDRKSFVITPHPRLEDRNFVLIPLFEISKNWKHPRSNIKISQLLKQIDTKDLRSITVE